MTHPGYMEYFKLRSQPFSEHAPSEALWNDTRMEEALARLQHLVQSGLLGLVTEALFKWGHRGLLPWSPKV